MKIAFAGLRHSHIFRLAEVVRSMPGAEITGAWEENEQAAQEAREKFTEPFYESFEALLEDPQVDAVAIGDYYGIRGERAIRALQAGKHVIADKPICTRLSELDEIERLCREKNLKVGCMLDLRYDPALRLAGKMIREGVLGEILCVNVTGQHCLSFCTRAKWYFEEGKHGGTFNDIAIHGIDALRMFTGMEYEKTFCARQWNAFAKDVPDFPDCAQMMGAMENGAGVTMDVSYSAPDPTAYSLPGYWRFSFFGEKGWIECRFRGGEVLTAKEGDSAARVIEAPSVNENYLDDFMKDINGEPTEFDTKSVLDSARATLNLQAVADRMSKGGRFL